MHSSVLIVGLYAVAKGIDQITAGEYKVTKSSFGAVGDWVNRNTIKNEGIKAEYIGLGTAVLISAIVDRQQ